MTSEINRKKSKTAETVNSGSLLLGLLVGFLVESNTNNVAREKVQTVAECIVEVAPEGLTLEQVECTSRPGQDGTQLIDPAKLSVGDSANAVDSYLERQSKEASHIELGRMLFWGLAGSGQLLTATLIVQGISE